MVHPLRDRSDRVVARAELPTGHRICGNPLRRLANPAGAADHPGDRAGSAGIALRRANPPCRLGTHRRRRPCHGTGGQLSGPGQTSRRALAADPEQPPPRRHSGAAGDPGTRLLPRPAVGSFQVVSVSGVQRPHSRSFPGTLLPPGVPDARCSRDGRGCRRLSGTPRLHFVLRPRRRRGGSCPGSVPVFDHQAGAADHL